MTSDRSQASTFAMAMENAAKYEDKVSLIANNEDEIEEDIGIEHSLSSGDHVGRSATVRLTLSAETVATPMTPSRSVKHSVINRNENLSVAHLQCSQSNFHHLCVVSVVVVAATVAAIALPQYLQAVNVASDAYCALLFTSLGCWLFIVLALAFVKTRSPADWGLKPPIPFTKVVKLGIYFGLVGLAVMYGRDRNRVLCHLQDPLTAAVLPMAVVFHLCIGLKVDKSPKLFCLAATIIGLFICIDFQIWDEFRCHGQNIIMGLDIHHWTPDEHAIWTIFYLAGLAVLALFFTFLERELRGKQGPEMMIATIPLTPCMPSSLDVDTIDNEPPEIDNAESSTQTMVVPYVPQHYCFPVAVLDFVQVLTLTAWLQTVSLCTVALLFWTDLFSFLGKAGSVENFNSLIQNGIACHFNAGTDCAALPASAWPFIVFSSILIVATVYLLSSSHTCNSAYAVAAMTVALPLSAFCWSFFQSDNGFHWQPKFSGEMGFTLVGLPIMAISLGFYRYYASKEKKEA